MGGGECGCAGVGCVLLSTFVLVVLISFIGFLISDTQRKTLANSVEERRRVLLLLGVLERREEVRVRRLGMHEGGMGTLLAELGWVFAVRSVDARV